jgi:hypothetical protein
MSDEFWTMFINTQKIECSQDQIPSKDTKEMGKREKEIIYRGRLGLLFKELNGMVPDLSSQKSVSRVLILEKTIQLIQQLKTSQMIMHQEKMNLAAENIQLKQLVHAYSNTTKTFPSPTNSFTL